MKIAIIGAGFTGLVAAYRLAQAGHKVTVFEKSFKPGGLAVGFVNKQWDWTLEEHYHHWFSNDKTVLSLAKELNVRVLLKRPKTSVYVDGSIFQLDSPKHVMSFPKLSILEKIRMATILALLSINPFWHPLEKIHAHTVLPATMGRKAYEMLWEPQFKNKFGKYYKQISLAWFWARIKARTPKLAYPEGGYARFAERIVDVIEDMGGKVKLGIDVKHMSSNKHVRINADKIYKFDKVVFTGGADLFAKLAEGLHKSYVTKLQALHSLGATNLVLRLKKQFMNDGTYWLSVCDPKAPATSIVEHTNFMSAKKFGGEHLVYVGNYLLTSDKQYKMNSKQILKLYDSFLMKINKNYKDNLIDAKLFKAPFAQPIMPVDYSKQIPSIKTPLAGVYLANMQQVYPWDRGTNYAVELGERVANVILDSVEG